MLKVITGTSGGYCHGLSRRNFVKIGVAGMASASLSTVLEARGTHRKPSANPPRIPPSF